MLPFDRLAITRVADAPTASEQGRDLRRRSGFALIFGIIAFSGLLVALGIRHPGCRLIAKMEGRAAVRGQLRAA